MYSEAEVEAIRRDERERTARATVRVLRDEILTAVRAELGLAGRQILTTREAARVLGCGVNRVRQYVHDGMLTPTEQAGRGGGWTFRRADVDALAGTLSA